MKPKRIQKNWKREAGEVVGRGNLSRAGERGNRGGDPLPIDTWAPPYSLSLSLSTIKNQGFGQPEHISNPGIEKGQYEFGPYDINLRSASLQSYLSAELQNLSFSILQIGTYMKSMKLQLLWFPDSENPWAAIWEPWINPALIGAHAAVV